MNGGVLLVGGNWPLYGGRSEWNWWALVGFAVLAALLLTARWRLPVVLSFALAAVGGLVLADLTHAWVSCPSGARSCSLRCPEASDGDDVGHRFDTPSGVRLNTSRRPTRGGSTWDRSSARSAPSPTKEVGEEYFEKRGLRRHAGVWSLWALGVGAVISGEFYGWNFGLGTGGFGGLAIAGVLMAIMYYGLVYSIAEMSPALPHTGGAYSFARSAMGPWGGFLTGLAENMEYVITPAVVAGAIALLMQEIVAGLFDITGDPWWNSLPIWALIFYAIFVGINIVGIEATMRFTVTITVLSLAVLAFFILAAIFSGKLDFNLWTNIAEDGSEIAGGGGDLLPFGISGIFKSLPFAIWFFLAIEEVPLAAEESMDPRRDVPKGSIWGMHTLLIAAVLVLIFNTALPGGAFLYGASGFPLLDGLFADLRREQRHRAPRAAVPDRPGGELLHDHLRVRAEHVLALAGRVLPEVPVTDPPRARRPPTSR